MASSLCLVALYQMGEDFEVPRTKLVGYFSRNKKFRHDNDISQLCYLTRSINDIPMNLNCKFDEAEWKREKKSAEILPQHFQYFIEHKNQIREFSRSKFEDVGFITNKRTFFDISAQLSDWKPITLYATLFQGNVYLDTKEPLSYSNRQENIGRKFVRLMTSDDPNVFPNLNKTIKGAENFFGIYETNINKHRILCGASTGSIFTTKGGINAIKISANLSEKETIEELQKRTFVRHGVSPHSTFRFKRYISRKLWIESLLSNTNDLYIGHYENDQTIDIIEHHTLDEISKMNEGWSPDEYLGFCDELLTFIKMKLKQEIEKQNIEIIDDDIRTIPKIQLTFDTNKVISLDLIDTQAEDIHLDESFTNKFM